MDPNQFLISWLRSHSLVNDSILTQAMRVQYHNPNQHLFQILVQLGAFTEDQGRAYYAQATQAFQSQSFENSAAGSTDVTLKPPPQSTPPQPATSHPIRPVSSKGVSQSSGSFTIPVFEKYDIEGEISRGGMGVVFRARYKDSSLEVALKVILDQAPPDEEIKRFRREAQTLAQIQHPGVVRIRDYGESEGRPYFAMDLIQGKPLKDAIDSQLRETGKVPAYSWTVKVFSLMGGALGHCHDLNIIHRDLKPANILLDGETEHPVIVDFGLVKRNVGAPSEEAESIDSLTNSQATLGTPAYMAPEQFDRQGPLGEVDKKSDVWGFGATLYYALTGQAPYTGETVFNIYKKLLKGDPLPPNTINPEIPDELNELCVSCLTRNKSQRPTMRAIEEALKQPLSDRSLHKKRSRQMTFFLWGGAIFLLLGLIATLSVVLRPQLLDLQAPDLKVDPISPTTNEETIEISGLASDDFLARVELRVGARTYKIVEGKERFSKTVPLKLGPNNVVIRAYDENGRFTELRQGVQRISAIPDLKIVAVPRFTYKNSISLTGEAPPMVVKIECDDQIIELKDNKFIAAVPLKFGANEIRLIASDKYGQSTTKLIACERNQVFTVGRTPPNPSKKLSSRHFTSLQNAINAVQKSSLKKPVPKILILDRELEGGVNITGRIYMEGIGGRPAIIKSKNVTCVNIEEGQAQFKNLTFETVLDRDAGISAFKLISGQVEANQCHFIGGYDSIRLGSEISLSRADLYPSIKLNSCTIEASQSNGIYARFKGQVLLKNCLIRGHKEAGLLIELTPGKGKRIIENRDSLIEGCTIEKNGLEGVEIVGPTRVVIRASKIRENLQEGILVDFGGLDALTLENCEIDRNGKGINKRRYPAVNARKGSGIRLKNCQIRDNYDEGLYCVDSPSYIIAEKCFIRGGLHGMKAYRNGKFILRNCTIRDCKASGLEVDGCQKIELSDSTVENCNYGFSLRKSSAAVVKNTMFKGNRYAGILCKERSSLFIKSSRLISNPIGISVRDKSIVEFSQCEFNNQLDTESIYPGTITERP